MGVCSLWQTMADEIQRENRGLLMKAQTCSQVSSGSLNEYNDKRAIMGVLLPDLIGRATASDPNTGKQYYRAGATL